MSALEEAWTVSRLARTVKQRVEQDFPATWVRGELVGLKRYPSGHLYFGLRDDLAKVDCTIWRSVAARLKTPLEDGMEVFALGTPSVWEERTALRFNIVQVLPAAAVGTAAQAVERTRQALLADGLLDPGRKRPLPPFPRRIALITSVAGAAVRDVITVARRRWPGIEVVVIGATVQGDAAPAELVAALELLPRIPDVDLCIIGRGGGAKEDLAAFNDEAVCRAIAAAPVPIVSAVGHEVDVTLADLVADVRAATPSQAAEFAIPERAEVARRAASLESALGGAMRTLVTRRQERLDRTRERMGAALLQRLRQQERRVHAVRVALPAALERHVRRPRERLAALGARLEPAVERRLARARAAVERQAAALHALSPVAVLGRGYAMARDETGRVLRQVADLSAGTRFTLRVSDGEVPARTLENP
ncbi:MAG TPA: exodeoxyribonuclease VII large subunit [Gemmatimonadales bacterium]|nr:exodeoxyribonuclease VII large subunit [Gemmatimonadales bacterium]MCB9517412.1 exodeoxyribonuclease VII large subunit [Gemmatimonadales bacterium]HPF62667.1 exodeoxyribonuclease VII large subunit [Gemmatimonadales bacterium]